MGYSIAETAKKYCVSPHTLRYYEKEGLLPFVERAPSGIREFKDSDFDWLDIIMCLKSTGMRIKDIKCFIDLCLEGESTYEKRLAFLRNQKAAVEKQLAELNNHLNTLNCKENYYLDAIRQRDLKK